ncbi:MAG TPA: ABC transporter permease, partial [Pyrinomonadaceae bacterium]|nr:ABC transporter permease [Pyrinomonadaceae bacterium]
MKIVGSSYYENLKMAMDTLRSNKLRSFLTIIGVVIGVISVMVIAAIISGINVAVAKQVESFGTRSIFLYKMDIGIRTSMPTREERMRKPLTMEDAEAIGNLPAVEVAVPFLDISNNFFGQKINVTGKNGKTSTSVQMQGTLPEVEKTTSETLIEGRWFSRSESDEKANVCLIGDSVKE